MFGEISNHRLRLSRHLVPRTPIQNILDITAKQFPHSSSRRDRPAASMRQIAVK